MMQNTDYDVAVVGASIAGCTAATLYGRFGLKVALIERRADMAAYKRMCTHYIQGCATPTLRRLGVVDAIEACGGVRNSVHLWTPYGWSRPYTSETTPHYGYNIRRQRLDPLLRKAAIATPGVTFFPGWDAKALVATGSRVGGVEMQNGRGERRVLRARLTVAADGRFSSLARLAGAKERIIPNNRVFFITYYRNLPLTTGKTSQLWFLDPAIAYAFPCDDGLTLLCAGIDIRRLASFREDVQKNFTALFASLPDGPDMQAGQRVADIIMGKCMHNLRRHHARLGFTLVGDALFAADPYPGVGIGWALQGAEWLVDGTAAVLQGGEERTLDRAVRRYERLHRARLAGHGWAVASYSSCRPFHAFLPPEKLLFSAAAKDLLVARHLDAYLNRVITLRQTLSSAILARALWVNLKARWRRPECNEPADWLA